MNPSRAVAAGRMLARQLCTSTQTAAEAVNSSKKPEQLSTQLFALGATGGSVAETLNDYVKKRYRICKDELKVCAKQLRKFRRHQHALEIMEWMKKKQMKFSFSDYGLYIDLLSKAKGIAAAEEYFNGLKKSFKGRAAYGTLLNCYCQKAMEDNALALFKEMEGLDFASSSLVYNDLMSLYMRIGKLEKLSSLPEEMKQKKIPKDSCTYAIWMQRYARVNDIEGVERVWKEMLDEDPHLCGYMTYSNVAAIYVKAGLSEKAEAALKKMETVMHGKNREAYHYLISLYAGINKLSEVNRIWYSLKEAFPVITNSSYLIMLQALRKLKDIEGLIKCFEEWESSCIHYDVRLTRVAISGSLDDGRLVEAKALFDDAQKKTNTPFLKGREPFMLFYLNQNDVSMAIEHLREAVSEAKGEKWVPENRIVDAFVLHLIKEKDIDSAEKCFDVLRNVDDLKPIAYGLLLKVYDAAERTNPEIRKMLEEDQVKIDGELENLLEKICPL